MQTQTIEIIFYTICGIANLIVAAYFLIHIFWAVKDRELNERIKKLTEYYEQILKLAKREYNKAKQNESIKKED